eukprot:6012700-Pleurochrysis_carterae.AAC.1
MGKLQSLGPQRNSQPLLSRRVKPKSWPRRRPPKRRSTYGHSSRSSGFRLRNPRPSAWTACPPST